MEELINKLLKKGWEPFGWPYYDRFIIESNWDMCFRWEYPWTDWTHPYDYNFDYFKIRELVSKESWLRQFCAENRLINSDDNYIRKWEQQCRYVYDDYDCWEKSQLYSDDYDYEYRIIESALKDEEDLEKFLLENIKVS